MPTFDLQLGPAIYELAQANNEVLAEALGGAFALDQAQLTLAAPTAFDPAALEPVLKQPCLALVLSRGEQAAAILLGSSDEKLAAALTKLDADARKQMEALARELAPLLFPLEFSPDAFQVAQLAEPLAELTAAQPSATAGQLTLAIQAGERTLAAAVVWPLQNGAALLTDGAVQPAAIIAAVAAGGAAQPVAHADLRHLSRPATGLELLPSFTRSLLKIRVPIKVSLATKKLSLKQILELGPGAIIQFEKSCEEMLDLEAGDQLIAQGEAVKVGDKFGLRLSTIVLPQERFAALKPGTAPQLRAS